MSTIKCHFLIHESIIYISRHLKDPIDTGNSATAILMWKPRSEV